MEERPQMMPVALFVGKGVAALSRLLRRGSGMTYPGVVAEQVHPNLVRDLAGRLENGAIVVTGTNGKTTTAKMIGDVLEASGHRPVRNTSGSNMRQGIASTLVASSTLGGRPRGDVAVLEVDEASMPGVLPDVNPSVICVTNLFRDQLDRYGDLDTTAGLIGEAIARNPGATLLLNADDPIVAGLARYAGGEVRYFGIDDSAVGRPSGERTVRDARCPECSAQLEFSHVYYSHLGDWHCPSCDHARPPLDFAAGIVKLAPDHVSFFADFAEESVPISLPAAGLHGVYNALAAAACSSLAGVSANEISAELAHFESAFGRTEELCVDGTPVTLLLAKNPTGAEQSLAAVLETGEPTTLALALNDNAADGTDVSWIWDVDFEAYDFSHCSVVLSGSRAEDLAVRLKYAGLDAAHLSISRDPVDAARMLAGRVAPGACGHILATYTAMLEIRNAFSAKGDPLSQLGRQLRHDS